MSPRRRRSCAPVLVSLAAVAVVLVGLLALLPAPASAAPPWVWPLPPPVMVLRGFAPPAHDWLPGHRGVDLAARAGQTVVAAGAGRVVVATRIGGIGVVAVRHAGGLETTYEPVRPGVRVGATVAAGAGIGTIAGRLAHCVPAVCLHWGLRRGGGYLDPLALLGAGAVRLLPMLRAGPDGRWALPAVGGASVGSSGLAVAGVIGSRRRRRRREVTRERR